LFRVFRAVFGFVRFVVCGLPTGRCRRLCAPNTFRTSRFIPAVEYIRAQRARTLLNRQMDALEGRGAASAERPAVSVPGS